MNTTQTPNGNRLGALADWRRYVPWEGRAGRTDIVLMAAIIAVIAFGLALRPAKPFLIASHPVLLAFLAGDLTAIGAAAAYARIGEAPLWLVILAGAVGMMKLDVLTWWTGRLWGGGIIRMFTTSQRTQRLALRTTELKPWILGAAVVLANLPGVPTPIVYAVAGMAGMRLITLVLLDLLGTLLITAVVAGLGYGLGQHAVDFVLMIDKYALLASITMLTTAAVLPFVKRLVAGTARRAGRGFARRSGDAGPGTRGETVNCAQ